MDEPHFIPSGVVVNRDHPQIEHFAKADKQGLQDRWRTREGEAILAAWRESGYKRQTLEERVGKLYDHLDLRGAPLSNLDLRAKDLHSIDLYAADLRQTQFTGADLTSTMMSEADIRGAKFDWCRMDQAFLDNATYDGNSSFLGVNLHAINFNLAVLLYEQAHTQQRIAHLDARHPALAFVLRWTCDYGRSLGRWGLWVAGVIVVFGLLFGVVPGLINKTNLEDGFYFSFVTFTTLGYGDVSPVSTLGKVLAVLEVVCGYLMGGLFIAILCRKVMGP